MATRLGQLQLSTGRWRQAITSLYTVVKTHQSNDTYYIRSLAALHRHGTATHCPSIRTTIEQTMALEARYI